MRTGDILKNSGILLRGRSQIQNSIFLVFRVPFNYPSHSLQWYRRKAETLKVCLLLVWRVYDQALGPWMVPKSGNVTITKTESLYTGTRRKIHWFQKCYCFRSTTKNNEVIAENHFRTVASPGACGRLAVLNIDARRQYILLVIIATEIFQWTSQSEFAHNNGLARNSGVMPAAKLKGAHNILQGTQGFLPSRYLKIIIHFNPWLLYCTAFV